MATESDVQTLTSQQGRAPLSPLLAARAWQLSPLPIQRNTCGVGLTYYQGVITALWPHLHVGMASTLVCCFLDQLEPKKSMTFFFETVLAPTIDISFPCQHKQQIHPCLRSPTPSHPLVGARNTVVKQYC